MHSPYIGKIAPRLAFLALGIAALTSVLVAEEPLAEGRAGETPAPPSGPRVVICLSSELFEPLVDRTIDVTMPVADVIVGTPVRGTSRTVGRPALALTDDPQAAAFTVTLTGTMVSRTTANEGPAIIHSRSDTDFTATKRIVFHPGKGFIAEPARINARTRTATEGIQATRQGMFGVIGRAIERRAAEEVASRRSQITAEARQKAEKRIASAFDQKLDERLADLNRRSGLQDRLAKWLGREGETVYQACTRGGCIHLAVAKKGDVVEIKLPAMTEKAAPIQLWMHKSLVGDQLAGVLKQIDETELPPLAAAAIEAVPTRMRPDLGLLSQKLPLDYVDVEEWVVLQYRPDGDLLVAQPDRTRRPERSARR